MVVITATAVRDYEYMNGHDSASSLQRLKFLEQTTKISPASNHRVEMLQAMFIQTDLEMKSMPVKAGGPNDSLRRWLSKTLPKSLLLSSLSHEDRLELLSGRHKLAELAFPLVDRLARFIVAIAGGLSLVVPMLIMSINQNLTKSLITSSVAVVLFAGLVSVVFSASNAETLGITAAYAAVLVVFVGTSAQQVGGRTA